MDVESRVLFTPEQISQRVRELAREISRDYEGRDIVLVGILKGASFFLVDLARAIREINEVGKIFLEFMDISSYGNGRRSMGVKIELDLRRSIAGLHAIVVEDIVETRQTLAVVRRHVEEKGPSSVAICVMFDKVNQAQRSDVTVRYVGFSLEDNPFLFGYGLDLAGAYRELREVRAAPSE